MPSKFKQTPSLMGSLSTNLTTLMFLPAYSFYLCAKTVLKMPFLPAIWMIKKINPNITDDIRDRKNSFKNKLKSKASNTFSMISGLVAK